MTESSAQPEKAPRHQTTETSSRARQELVEHLAVLVVRQHRRQTRLGAGSRLTGTAGPSGLTDIPGD
jgi:hypothetical protein